jgi:hypothetical protein
MEKLIEGVEQSARQGVLAATWPRYVDYRVERHADGEVWAVAEHPAHWREGRWVGLTEEQKDRAIASDSLASYQGRLYFPLADTPDLFIRFARLEPTEEEWQSFLRRYGALGQDPRRDRFSRFVEEVRQAKRVLKLYEAATAEPAEVNPIASIFGEDGVLLNSDQWAKRTSPPEASRLALKEVDVVIREMLRAETFADLRYEAREEQPLLSLAVRSLLGCIWIQFAFARTLVREPRRCEAEDCYNLLAASPGAKKAVYKNKRFCSKACSERDRYARKKWSRTLSTAY